MLENYVAPDIGQKLSSSQRPIVLGAGLYITCRGERVLLVIIIRFNATFLLLRVKNCRFLERCINCNNIWLRAFNAAILFIFVLML